jgi:putative Ca2+/H+ antiporter (TMEM165/GDT1 family)
MFPILVATYGTVFVAEIVGDKLLYTTGILATRYRAIPILCGMTVAFMAKMAVAVGAGRLISTLPPLLVAAITAINFFAIALALWRRPDRREVREQGQAPEQPAWRAVLVSFSAIFFSEWGDFGQVTAASLAAKFAFEAPADQRTTILIFVWIGAVAAMVTKGALAASIGAGVRGWIQRTFAPKTIRYAAVALLLLLGTLSVIETLEGPEKPAVWLLSAPSR